MEILLSSRSTGRQRWLLTVVLGLVAAMLLAGGTRLAVLGGSTYYFIAGIFVAACAWLSFRGDERDRWLYLLFFTGTLAWTLWERGTNPWALQARLLAPAVLGIWVLWPQRLICPRLLAACGLVAVAVGVWLSIHEGNGGFPSDAVVAKEDAASDWLHYGNDLGGTRYAPLAQISPANVGQLREVWRIQTGAESGLGFEATPLFVKDTLYLCTPDSVILALEPESGKRRWTYDPHAVAPGGATCRGVAYHKIFDANGTCSERIISATADARLIAVDRYSGKPCKGFGDGGTVDLKRGLGPFAPGYWRASSAPALVRGNIIIGASVADNQHVGEPSGVIRAYDAVTGKLAWAWDMGRPDERGEPPAGQTYTRGTPNSWAPMSGDEALGLVFVPLGNATPDYWGGHRSAQSEKFTDAVVALDAVTGEVRWSFQTTHHDLWDYDLASQPTLMDLPIGGQQVPALIQPTKRGQIFLLDRRNGKTIARVEERPVPQGAAAGDFVSPTQPFSTSMPAFDDATVSERTMWGLTPLDQMWCRIKFREARYEGTLTPPGTHPTISYPSYQGGINWGGVSVDPIRQLMVVNWGRLANYTRLIPRKEADAMGVHTNADGTLQGLGQPNPQKGTPFAVATAPFWSPLKVPCTEPPFGKIAVVDLKRRKLLWQRPFGTSRDSGPLGIESGLPLPMGVPNIGGSLVTKSGLIFIGATQERAIRAYDILSGRELWRARLPAGGQATPMTFVSRRNGRQYVIISAGGHHAVASKTGDFVVAYALQ